MNSLIQLDRELFETINGDWTNSFFDWLLPAITDLHKDPRFFLALLPLLVFWIYRSRRYALKWLLITALSVGLSDLISYRVIKANVQRDRPQFSGVELSLRTHSHTGTSFPSNHSANVFAAATSLSGALPKASPLFFAIAFAIAYSRVYVGVHFPLDVTAGAILGILLSLLVALAFRRWRPGSGGASHGKSGQGKKNSAARKRQVARSGEGSAHGRS